MGLSGFSRYSAAVLWLDGRLASRIGSGALFTADPVSGGASGVVIEGTRGLGDRYEESRPARPAGGLERSGFTNPTIGRYKNTYGLAKGNTTRGTRFRDRGKAYE
jgi:hypothetical protein